MQNEPACVRRALHDLQQPLNVIRLASGNIRARLAAGLDPLEEQYLHDKLDRIDGQVMRAARQIEHLLATMPRPD